MEIIAIPKVNMVELLNEKETSFTEEQDSCDKCGTHSDKCEQTKHYTFICPCGNEFETPDV